MTDFSCGRHLFCGILLSIYCCMKLNLNKTAFQQDAYRILGSCMVFSFQLPSLNFTPGGEYLQQMSLAGGWVSQGQVCQRVWVPQWGITNLSHDACDTSSPTQAE